MDDNKSAFEQMAAALNNAELTDDEGQIKEDDTSAETPATQEANTLEEAAPSEKTEASRESAPAEDEEDETIPAVDDKGKRYIPEKRFKKTYAEKKQLERELAELRARQQQQAAQPDTQKDFLKPAPTPTPQDDVETEMLFMKYPQFNPESEEYSEALDAIGAQIYKANPGMTRIRAAKLALDQARKLTADQARIVAEARAVKSQQSDQGITSRVLNRTPKDDAPGEGASLEEMEAYLRKTGQW